MRHIYTSAVISSSDYYLDSTPLLIPVYRHPGRDSVTARRALKSLPAASCQLSMLANGGKPAAAAAAAARNRVGVPREFRKLFVL